MVGTLNQEVARFNEAVERTAKGLTEDQLVLFHKKIHLDGLRRIVLKTPVLTGRARGNWQTTIGIPASEEIDRESKRGTDVIGAEGLVKLAFLRAFQVSWITNNLPYIEVLERGLYPKTVKRGTLVPKRRGGSRYEIRSSGGFSKQAPQGMVAITVAELRLMFP
ncbi:MAG: hypothetical protein DRH08_00150 [Deltaproteobacteria bacterium]|nr:MAG: hypothetical protein DRH08_00150 [Deltaproteobacteria bacterium]